MVWRRTGENPVSEPNMEHKYGTLIMLMSEQLELLLACIYINPNISSIIKWVIQPLKFQKLIIHFITQIMWQVITYPCLDWSRSLSIKGVPLWQCCIRKYPLLEQMLLLRQKYMTTSGRSWYTIAGVGVTKAPFVNFSVNKMFDLSKVPVGFFESLPYLTGITAAELKNSENNGTEEIG